MLRQPKLILKVVHSVEDCNDTLAFAAEPVIASLANILAYQASVGGRTVNGPPSTGASIITTTAMPRPAHAREYNFLDFEIKYGIRQIAEALDFLSPQVHHHNVCPSSILVTKTGTWKLSGLEFIGITNGKLIIQLYRQSYSSNVLWDYKFKEDGQVGTTSKQQHYALNESP
ncbi:hypothetical protein AGLY_009388 [Aphis glycines]|uniref:Protein kinase domain-containing protein n=1 Tax=Aphis glycines TaxID=307491 RepID=A0A6G0TJJ3_APHGL|nr:hypothetical protein AGLY_009388 [Aphis glycines]